MTRKSIADIRKEEIIQAFFTVVADKGYSKATIREIAKYTGCSYRMLLHYFATKEEIVLAAQQHMADSYLTDLRQGMSDTSKTATERLNFMFSYFNDPDRFSFDFCRAWIEIWTLTKVHPAIADTIQRGYDTIKEMIADIIRDGMSTGEFRNVDPTVTANLVLATCEGVTMLWAVTSDGMPVQRINQQIPEYCLHYLKKE